MARPRKLSPELTAKIVERIIEGNRPQLAANMVGISSSTFFEWMSKGKNLEAEFLEFSEAITRAFAQAVILKIGIIHRAATKGDWRASAYWLEKNCPEIYGKQRRQQKTIKASETSLILEDVMVGIQQKIEKIMMKRKST